MFDLDFFERADRQPAAGATEPAGGFRYWNKGPGASISLLLVFESLITCHLYTCTLMANSTGTGIHFDLQRR